MCLPCHIVVHNKHLLNEWVIEIRKLCRMNSLTEKVRHPTPVLLPGKSHGWKSLVGCSPWGHKESDTTEWLHFHFSLSCIGEGNGNPLQCSCLENPGDEASWWASVYGVAQSRTRLKRLSSNSSSSSSSRMGICWPRLWGHNLIVILFCSLLISPKNHATHPTIISRKALVISFGVDFLKGRIKAVEDLWTAFKQHTHTHTHTHTHNQSISQGKQMAVNTNEKIIA